MRLEEAIMNAVAHGSLTQRWGCDCGNSGQLISPARGSRASRARWLRARIVRLQHYGVGHKLTMG